METLMQAFDWLLKVTRVKILYCLKLRKEFLRDLNFMIFVVMHITVLQK